MVAVAFVDPDGAEASCVRDIGKGETGYTFELQPWGDDIIDFAKPHKHPKLAVRVEDWDTEKGLITDTGVLAVTTVG